MYLFLAYNSEVNAGNPRAGKASRKMPTSSVPAHLGHEAAGSEVILQYEHVLSMQHDGEEKSLEKSESDLKHKKWNSLSLSPLEIIIRNHSHIKKA